MLKKPSRKPLPPLSLPMLKEVQDVEETARQFLERCKTPPHNIHKPARVREILRACAVAHVDAKLTYYQSMSGFCSKWVTELKNATIDSILECLPRLLNRYEPQFRSELQRTIKDHLKGDSGPITRKAHVGTVLPGAIIEGEVTSAKVGAVTEVYVHGLSGPLTSLRAKRGSTEIVLPGATIVGVPLNSENKYVAWNGETYVFRPTVESILSDDTLMLIGRVKELTEAPDSPIEPSHVPPLKRETLEVIQAGEPPSAPAPMPQPAAEKGHTSSDPLLLKYRSAIKRVILGQLMLNPTARDQDICRALDSEGSLELPESWKSKADDRLFEQAYRDPGRRRRVEIAISKIRTDLRRRGMLDR